LSDVKTPDAKTIGAYTEESEKFKAKNEKLLNSKVLPTAGGFTFFVLRFTLP